MIQIFGNWIVVSLLQLSWIWLFWQRDGSGCPFFYWEADYIEHILKMLKEGGNGTCEAQSEGESNLRPYAGLIGNVVANKARGNQGKDQDVVRLLNVICVLCVCIVLALVLVVVVQLCK
jgi:hypothetical protein